MRTIFRNIRPSFGWLTVITLFALPMFTLTGAVDMFLKLDGIKGETLDKARAGDIDILAWNWGASNSGTTHSGTGTGSGKASIQDISVTKFIDRTSPALLLNAMNGKQIATGELVVRTAGLKPLEYLKFEMKNILVTSVSTGGSGGEDRLTENVVFNFAKFRLTYTPIKADGTLDTPVVTSWDITTNTPTF